MFRLLSGIIIFRYVEGTVDSVVMDLSKIRSNANIAYSCMMTLRR